MPYLGARKDDRADERKAANVSLACLREAYWLWLVLLSGVVLSVSLDKFVPQAFFGADGAMRSRAGSTIPDVTPLKAPPPLLDFAGGLEKIGENISGDT